ncbi:hypothetical protein ABT099_23795 [Streptomyces prasinus]|uniref:hypothetical protein n=1 Tax=Streptomyces prasinus TaxID=67345 RepID=UPI0033232801
MTRPFTPPDGWLCLNHPFGHRWINRPFPNQGTHCENCGITPEAAAKQDETAPKETS